MAQSTTHADLVLRGGTVLTLAGSREATALAVDGDRIRAIGEDAEISALAGPATKIIELGGRTLMRGKNRPAVRSAACEDNDWNTCPLVRDPIPNEIHREQDQPNGGSDNVWTKV